MKKQVKKLKLAKETLRNLSGGEMKEAVGGKPPNTIDPTCDPGTSCDFCDRSENC
jgi:hypothetical protein